MKYIWLIPILPALGAFLNGVLGKKYFSRRIIHTLACGTVFLSFILAVFFFIQLLGKPAEQRTYEINLYSWIQAGESLIRDGRVVDFNVNFSFLFDPLSAVMLLIVTGVGFLIHLYSIGYMAHEGGYYRFFAYLNLFMSSMLILVLGGNFLVMFIGWEGVGLCSYLLIGFYFDRASAAAAGKKAFLVNRIGDFGFLIGICTIFAYFGTFDFLKVFPQIALKYSADDPLLTIIGLLLLIGVAGKSAQIPLYVWLPDAMEGPTPVSALIHAATMVTAGVYMISRCNIIYSLSSTASLVVALIGGCTALFAATIGLVQNDIKRVLAYSTISQLGYMVMATGAGAYSSGIAHLMTHAFFKALLFLGAGSVIHALSGIQDMRIMGGLKNKLPTTYWTFAVATLAISGIPPLSGFFSKDEILWQAFSSPVFMNRQWNIILWALGFLAAGLTAFYMFRLLFLTFYGTSRYPEKTAEHLHESPASMLIPLRILAILSIIGGIVAVPKLLQIGPLSFFEKISIERFLEPSMYTHGEIHKAVAELHLFEPLLMIASVLIAVAGIYAAYLFYIKKPALPRLLAQKFDSLHTIIYNKYYIDELYDWLFVRSTKAFGTLLALFDTIVIDGFINLTARSTIKISTFTVKADLSVVDGAVNGIASFIREASGKLKKMQTGLVQNYLLIMLYSSILIFALYLLFFWN